MKNLPNTLKALVLIGLTITLFAADAGDAAPVAPNQQRADEPIEEQILG
jgi:hypothetical protein